jgi:hypothetical protein
LAGDAILPLLLVPLLVQGSDVKRGDWKPRDVPPGWHLLETASYQIQSQIGSAATKRTADHLEGMMATYRRLLPFKKEARRFTVKIFANRANYLDYGAPRSSLAYYSEGEREVVAFDTGLVGGVRTRPAEETAAESRARLGSDEPPADAPEPRKEAWPLLQELLAKLAMDLLGVLSHEGWHQYFHHFIVSKVDFPSWLDEGLGDFFSEASPGLASGEDLRSVRPAPVRVAWIRIALLEGRTAPFQEIVRFRQSDYYRDTQAFYAQGWSMTHFLLTHADPKVRAIVPTLIHAFKDTHHMDRSTDRAFRGHDVSRLAREWERTVAALEIPDPEIRDLVERIEAIYLRHAESR